jgi:hypothetical protein
MTVLVFVFITCILGIELLLLSPWPEVGPVEGCTDKGTVPILLGNRAGAGKSFGSVLILTGGELEYSSLSSNLGLEPTASGRLAGW